MTHFRLALQTVDEKYQRVSTESKPTEGDGDEDDREEVQDQPGGW